MRWVKRGLLSEKIKKVYIGEDALDLLNAALPPGIDYTDSHLNSSFLFSLETENVKLPQGEWPQNPIDELESRQLVVLPYGSEKLPPLEEGVLQIEKGRFFVIFGSHKSYLPVLKPLSALVQQSPSSSETYAPRECN